VTAPAGEAIGKYRILGRLGRGGMGTVFRARDPVLGREVAVKIISPEVEVTDELRARFYREAQACARLSHPNVVTVHDLGEDGGRLYIVMELVEGDELRQLIAAHRPERLETRLELLAEVCDGLHYAHQRGVVHRDVKPANVLVQRNGHPKVLDFGLARLATEGADLTRTGLFMGTLRYMAPEQARGGGDHRSDIFATGALGYELLAFRPPFPADDPIELLDQIRSLDPPPLHQVDPAIPPELDAIIRRALAKDPAERYADLGAMKADLEAARRRLGEGVEQLRDRVRARLAELRALRAASGTGEATEVVLEETAGTARLRELDARLTREIARLRAAGGQAPPVPGAAVPAATAAAARPPGAARRAVVPVLAGIGLVAMVGAGLYAWHRSDPAPPAPIAAVAPGSPATPGPPAAPPPSAPAPLPAGVAASTPSAVTPAPRPPAPAPPAPIPGGRAGATAASPPGTPPAAAVLVTPPATAPPPTSAAAAPAPAERPDQGVEIRGVIDRYRRAIESRDLELLRQVRPGLGPPELARLRQVFQESRQHALELRIDDVKVGDADAEVTGRRRDTVVGRDGQTFHNEGSVVFRLRRTPTGWVIVAVE
jgi:serine/threonine-protein kinase